MALVKRPALRRIRVLVLCSSAFIAGCAMHRALPPGNANGQEAATIVGARRFQSEVRFAVDAADEIYGSDAFWDLVSKRAWLDGPDGNVLRGEDVARVLRHSLPSRALEYDITRLGWDKFTFGLKKGSTVASTAACGTVSLDRRHIGSLDYLVNTISHENTHTLGFGTGERQCDNPTKLGSRFTDGTHPPELEVWLVSYAIGDMAQCFYEQHEDAGAQFGSCFDMILDGAKPRRQGAVVARSVLECCDIDSGVSRVQRAALRKASPWCATVSCPT